MKPTDTTPPPSPSGERSSAPPSPRDIGPVKDQLREIFGRTAYSHKAQIIQAGFETNRHWWIKTTEIALSAITTAGLITTLLGDGKVALGLSALSSAALLALIAYTKDFDLGTKAEQHKRTADELWYARESYLSLLTDIEAGAIAQEAILEKRDALLDRLNTIYSTGPQTTKAAYAAAQEALKFNEDLTFSDSEIDLLLPQAIRSSSKASTPDTPIS